MNMSSAAVDLNQFNKRAVWDFWQALETAGVSDVDTIVGTIMSEDVTWHGFAPLDELHGREQFVSEFWQPLLHAFPDLRRETFLFHGGQSNGRWNRQLSRHFRSRLPVDPGDREAGEHSLG